MKIDAITIEGKELTEYTCPVSGEPICIGDHIQWTHPSGKVHTSKVERIGGKLMPFERKLYPSRMSHFGNHEYVDTDDILMDVASLPFVKL